MTKKRIIAYALAITSLFGVYKGRHKLGEHIRENYLNESFSDSTLNNETTINETLSAIVPTKTIISTENETISTETTISTENETISTETTISTESAIIPTETTVPSFTKVFIPSFATDDLVLFDDNDNIIYTVEKYDKLTITKIFENKVECLTTDGYFGYTDFNLLKQLPETYAEVDISMQKVYCYYQGKLVLIADCVTGIPTYGTTKGTNKGYTEINGKAYDTKLMGDAPADIFISFNPDGEGFHDARWRSQFGGEIYLTNGSHGCVNMRLEDVKVLDKFLKAGDRVLVHK